MPSTERGKVSGRWTDGWMKGWTDGWMGDKRSGKEGTGRRVYRDAGVSEPVCPGPQRAPTGWEA